MGSLENYIKIFADKDFVNAFGFTLKFSVVSIITINVFAFILALALTRKIKGTNLFRTVFFMPNLIGGIILGYIWQQMINAVLLKYETTLVRIAHLVEIFGNLYLHVVRDALVFLLQT